MDGYDVSTLRPFTRRNPRFDRFRFIDITLQYFSVSLTGKSA